MRRGSKRPLAARLMAGAGSLWGIRGFTMSPPAAPAGLAAFPWLVSGTLLRVLAVYVLAPASVAVQKATQDSTGQGRSFHPRWQRGGTSERKRWRANG
jgi:hypothetical protein